MRKVKSTKGFTLMEMLICMITLLLIGMIVSTGMNLATMSLRETTFESDSQMLESTLNTYIGDILRHATEINDSSDPIKFSNSAYYIEEGSFKIDYVEGVGQNAGYLVCSSKLNEFYKDLMVANQGVYLNHLYIRDFTLQYDSVKKVFTGSYYIVSTTTKAEKFCEFSFRTIAE